MKKFFLLITILSISIGAIAQRGKVTSALSFIEQGILDKAKENIEEALVHDKTKDWFNTYFAKGQLCQATFESENEEFSAYYPNPLQEAYSSYEKALELDDRGTVKKKIIAGMVYNSLAVDLFTQGSARFEAGDFDGALSSFETQIEITESDKYAGALDTGMYYNAGLAAVNAEKHNEAIKYFETCAEMKYLGITPYFQMSQSYLSLGDTVKAESILTSLTDLFPDDEDVTLNLIDLYIKSNKNEEALELLEVAKKADPDNHNLFLAAGILHLNSEEYDQAIVELSRSIELEPELYDSQYGMGASYINKASEMFIKANEIMDVNEYSKAIDEANAIYEKALPFMEKAIELSPDDIFTMRGLQELYYRLKQKDPSLAPKYDAVKARLDAIDNQ